MKFTYMTNEGLNYELVWQPCSKFCQKKPDSGPSCFHICSSFCHFLKLAAKKDEKNFTMHKKILWVF